jgi:uncharacterized protein
MALSALLILYGNVAATALGQTAVTRGWLGAIAGLGLTCAVLIWARWTRLSFRELGIRGAGAVPSGALGAIVAIAAAVGSLAVLRFPPLAIGPITYLPLRELTEADLYLRVLVLMPLDTVLPEEIAFRGALLGLLRRGFGTYAAIVRSAVPFVLWHTVMVWATVSQTNLVRDPALFALGCVGAFVALLAGGVAFAYLRVVTGHLAAPIAAHWTFNGAILLGLRWLDGAA